MDNKLRFFSLIGLVFVCMSTHSADDLKVKLSTGFDYSTGDYGDTQDTNILYIPFTTKATKGNWTAKLTVPYLEIEGPGAVVGSGDISVQQNGGNIVTTESGLGDVVAGLTYTFDLEQYDTYVDVISKVKIPTADEDKGLGTGETDFTFAVDVTKIFGQAYVFGGVGRKFVGDKNQFQLDDIFLFNIGGGYQMTKKTGVGASYDFREAAGSGEDPSEITIYAVHKITNDISLQGYGVIGFSNGSPDTGIGVQIGYRFDPRFGLF